MITLSCESQVYSLCVVSGTFRLYLNSAEITCRRENRWQDFPQVETDPNQPLFYFQSTLGMAEDVIQVPREFSSALQLQELCHRFKALRLRALHEDPDAFTSTYADEAQFSDEIWATRLQNPFAKTFVAVRKNNDDTRVAQ